MTFNSVTFLFYFLPLVVLLYYVLPGKFKNVLLVLASLLFYAWGNPKNLLYLLFLAVFNYLTGLEISSLHKSGNDRAARIVIWLSAGADILLLCLFKYWIGRLPLGLSFLTFTVLSYILDIYHGKTEAQKNPLPYLLYISFFAKVSSGPIVQYAEMEPSLGKRGTALSNLTEGLFLFSVGLGKKVILADQFGIAFSSLTGGKMSVLSAWLGMIFYGLQLYFDFSGYSDMAIGIARMFGFRFSANFDYPYCSRSIAEFWRRWHISLGNWFKEYVYFPLGGSRVSTPKLLRNLLIVWILTGIWHGNTGGFILWGLFHGLFVILDRYVLGDHLSFLPGWLRSVLTSLIAMLGWVFFFSGTAGKAFAYFGYMLGSGGAFADKAALFALSDYGLLLLAGLIGCTPLIRNLWRKIFLAPGNAADADSFASSDPASNKARILTIAACILQIAILFTSIACMLSSTYTTFLYAAF